jgi:hypothetical protein
MESYIQRLVEDVKGSKYIEDASGNAVDDEM